MADGAEIQAFTTERRPAFRSDVFRGAAGAELPLAALVETLVVGLGADALIGWITRGARQRDRALKAYARKLTNDALTCDGVLASADAAGVALVTQPDVELAPPAMTTMSKITGHSGWRGVAEGLEELVAARPADAAYLAAICVRAGHRDRDLAGSLFACARQIAPSRQLCLDVSKEEQIGFYREFGFEPFAETQVYRGPKVWTLAAPAVL